MSNRLDVFWQALDRMVTGSPYIVPPGTKISFDTVCIEAGRGRGSLKATRPQDKEIRSAILLAAQQQQLPHVPKSKAMLKKQAKSERENTKHYKQLNQQILARELMLLRRIDELEREIDRLQGLRIVKFK